jgi:hypothetical protein
MAHAATQSNLKPSSLSLFGFLRLSIDLLRPTREIVLGRGAGDDGLATYHHPRQRAQ